MYMYGSEHHNWKAERNNNLIHDRYPNWPATSTVAMSISELQAKYGLTFGRVYAIIKRMKEEEFGYAD